MGVFYFDYSLKQKGSYVVWDKIYTAFDMIHLEQLTSLDKHQHFLQKRINNPNLFLVWGCVRDLLLGITKDPMDIDFTMGGTPEELYAEFNTQGLSHFITEKFGTITFIPPENKERNYQLTPLRTEWEYGDFRHPEEIHRSTDLILDCQRRDFSINAMYYFSIDKKTKASLDFSKEGKEINKKQLTKILNNEWYCYIANLNLLILRDESFIRQVFWNAEFDEDYFRYLIETQNEAYFRDTGKKNKDIWTVAKIKRFRVLIDPAGGIDSLINRKLDTVGDADKRFWEDALRLIRALRIVNICNHALLKNEKKQWKIKEKTELFDFSSETWDSIKRNSQLIQHVAKERIKDELCKVFKKGNPFGFIVLLNVSGMLAILFPALSTTKYNEQPIRYHAFDTYTHTLLTLKALQEINQDYLVRFAMLYHDTGKVAQYAAYEKAESKEEIRSIIAWPLNHRNSSPELMKKDFRALWFSNKEIDTIAWYIAEHHTPGEILSANPDNREKKVRKLLSEKGLEMVNNLFDINIADRLWQFNPLQNSADLRDSYELKVILQKLHHEEWQFKKSDLAVNGSLLMRELQLEAGPLLGELLQQAFDWVINDIPLRNNEKEIFVYLRSYLKNKKTPS